jgi:hypothetical protein
MDIDYLIRILFFIVMIGISVKIIKMISSLIFRCALIGLIILIAYKFIV